MPITQQRMIALIGAAQEFVSAWDNAKSIIAECKVNVRNRRMTAEEALDNILLLITEEHCFKGNYGRALAAILNEQNWFHFAAAKNNYNARYAESKRRAAGIEPRDIYQAPVPSVQHSDAIYTALQRPTKPNYEQRQHTESEHKLQQFAQDENLTAEQFREARQSTLTLAEIEARTRRLELQELGKITSDNTGNIPTTEESGNPDSLIESDNLDMEDLK